MSDDNGNEDALAVAAKSISKALDQVFLSSQSVDEMIEAFEHIMASFSCVNQPSPVFYCWAITDQLLRFSHNPQQVFSFGKTALQVFVRKTLCFPALSNVPLDVNNINVLRRDHGSSFFIACVCYLLGAACFGLQRYDECSGFLDWAEENLTSTEITHCDRNCVRKVLLATHVQLYNLKLTVGKRDEAVVNIKKAIEFKELTMVEGRVELGNAYVEAYEACVAAMDVTEALPLCLKALEIRTVVNGVNSLEVVLLRVDLAIFYYAVGEFEKAGEENRLWESVLTNTDVSDDLLNARIKCGTRLIQLGRFGEAIEVLKAVITRRDTKAYGRVNSFVNMARAYCMLGKVDDAKESLKSAVGIISKGGNDITDLVFLGNVFVDISALYEKMEDFESAVIMLKRTFTVSLSRLQILAESLEEHDPQNLLAESPEKLDHQKLLAGSSRGLFSLISLAGREEQEIHNMRYIVEMLEKSFGREHIEVGYGCAKLGAALSNSGQEGEAVKFIEYARDIMDVALGPHHVDSLRTSHTLSEIYVKLGRCSEALEIQKKVLEDGKGLEPSEQEFLDKAAELLNKMKEIVAESATRASSQTQDGKDHSKEKSDCGNPSHEAHPSGGA